MKRVPLLLSTFFCLLFLGACKEDEYVYPNVISTFIDVTTDTSGTLQDLITDKGETLQILNREGLDGLTPDSTYRTVSIYEPKETDTQGNATALLYSCQLIIAVKPVTANKLPDGIAKTDPLNIQSVWKSGNYLNLILLPMAKEKSHIFHFIEDGITDNEDGSRTLHLTLYHNQNGDYEAFTRKSYLSIPLWAYEGRLAQGDQVILRINTYEKGFVSYEFTY
ncbi:NigD1/NigD2 family lipoprotein [Bacteroides mediterraneensis]|uniref:NigD-like protein n=1 Tax=Bacteroides mediterraneensis TaxID=1841856 RepID=UPI0009348001|nr:NigD-like protein [Bacteroides mediterraneensis]